MAKIAAEFQGHPRCTSGCAAGRPAKRLLAQGDGWTVSDVICHAGPRNRPFEEQFARACVAIVVAGSFQYRSSPGRELMTPGSLLLGNAAQQFECGHEHEVGDRCLSFSYEQRYLEDVVDEAGLSNRNATFSALCVPPVREISKVVARAHACLFNFNELTSGRNPLPLENEARKTFKKPMHEANGDTRVWEEIAFELAARTLDTAGDEKSKSPSSPAAEARVTRVVRRIEARPDSPHPLGDLAREAGLSRYHFLRVFQLVTKLTPHQYILRARLRRAAARLLVKRGRVVDIAFDSGFGDVSNFNHAFRKEFGMSPSSLLRAVGQSNRLTNPADDTTASSL